MTVARAILMLVAISFAMNPANAQPPQKMIAVLEFSNEARMTKFEAEALADNVRGTALLLPRERFLVMTRESMLMLLPPGTDLSQCSGAQCEVEAGQKVGADLVVSGNVGKFAKQFRVRLKLFDTHSAALLSQQSAKGKDLLDLEADLRRKAILLFSRGLRVEMEAQGTVKAKAPPPVVDDEPLISSSAHTVPVGDLTIYAKPRGTVRLEMRDPEGHNFISSSPYKNADAVVGQWSVKATAQGFEPEERIIMVPADDVVLLKVELKSLCDLNIVGNPTGAKVVVNGPEGFNHQAGLPWSASRLKSGQYRIEVSRNTYKSHSEEVDLEPGDKKTVKILLEKDSADSHAKVAGLKWVLIPGGLFTMGSSGISGDEKPPHRVRISRFYMARTEVTVAQYRACVNAGRCTNPSAAASICNWGKSGRDEYPVNCVDWNQAKDFAEWVGGRLPSEAEWEYASRSGGLDRKYPWGNNSASCQYSVMDGCGGFGTRPVCSKTSGNTRQGLCDMAGNVSEWTQDWYHESYQGAPTDGRAWTSPQSSFRVTRGGAWSDTADYHRCVDRDSIVPSSGIINLGFRPVKGIR